jgi:hypothetical protein
MRNGKVVDFELKGAKKGDKIKVSCPADPDFVQLPGEPEYQASVGFAPFPDALCAFVFKNWSLVDAETHITAVKRNSLFIVHILSNPPLFDPIAHTAQSGICRFSGSGGILFLPFIFQSEEGKEGKELSHA